MKSEKSSKLFYKDFNLMVIGQIISLFGNNILRFALPLHLLNQTGSPALFGIVSAISFIPAILLSPVGGIIADRVNKRNIMVILDFFTAALVLVFTFLLGQVSLVPLMIVTMMILFGIQGAYSPSVQSSVPVMMEEKNIVPANAVINLVESMAGLIGPVTGGLLYASFGLIPILIISVVCFFFSATMEIFIHIPFHREKSTQSVLETVKGDLKGSVAFIKEQPIIGKSVAMVAAFNLFLTSMLMVGMPTLITEFLPFEEVLANQLYGYAQGALAAGGLIGGMLAGVIGKKIRFEHVYRLLLGTALAIVPIIVSLWMGLPAMVTFVLISVCCFAILLLATMFTVLMLSFIQKITPENLLGKIISVVMAVCMCAQPVGQALYGVLFENMMHAPQYVLLLAAVGGAVISLLSRRVFAQIDDMDPAAAPKAKKKKVPAA